MSKSALKNIMKNEHSLMHQHNDNCAGYFSVPEFINHTDTF